MKTEGFLFLEGRLARCCLQWLIDVFMYSALDFISTNCPQKAEASFPDS